MRAPANLFRQGQVFIASFTCIAALILSINSRSPVSSSSQNRNVQMKNRTESLQVVDVEQAEKSLTLRLKNLSNKNIDGYTLLLGDGGTITTDYTNTDMLLAPGATTEATIPLETSSPSGQAQARQSITILTVTFTDGSSDGDDKAARDIKDRRLGIKLQLKRVTALIKNIMKAPGNDASSVLANLQALIQALPERTDDSSSLAVRNGLYDAKQDALMMLQRLEQKRKLRGASTIADLQADLAKELAEFEIMDSRI